MNQTVLPGQKQTKYIITLVALAIIAFVLIIATHLSLAVAESQLGSINVNATVPGDPPQIPAHISVPSDNSHFTSRSISVSGECETDKIIQIYKNNIFAGSTVCNGGKFSIILDLVYGKNELVARTYDSLYQRGPDSNLVTVYYDSEQDRTYATTYYEYNDIDNQLIVLTDKDYLGAVIQSDFRLKAQVIGGREPYAVYIGWGDGSKDLILQPDSTEFIAKHTYKYAGNYNVSIDVVDTEGQEAGINVVVIVDGKPVPYAPSILNNPQKTLPILSALWQVYIVVVFSAFSFWLGEKSLIHRYRSAK